MKILSISVFCVLLILVGITIVGIRKFEVIISKKSEVALFVDVFNRSKLKSPAINISLLEYFESLLMKGLSSNSLKSSASIDGCLYTVPMIVLVVFGLIISTNTDSSFFEEYILRSVLGLKFRFLLI